MDRPEVDDVSGIPPTVAIEQRMSQGGRRSTVATLTEIYHYLRLLYSKLGVQHCPGCGEPIVSQTPEAMLEEIGRRFGGRSVTVTAPLIFGRKGFHRELLTKLKKQGFRQVRVDGRTLSLDPVPSLDRFREHDIDAVIGKVKAGAVTGAELQAVVGRALALGRGSLQGRRRPGRIMDSQREALLPPLLEGFRASRPEALLLQQPLRGLPPMRGTRRCRRCRLPGVQRQKASEGGPCRSRQGEGDRGAYRTFGEPRRGDDPVVYLRASRSAHRRGDRGGAHAPVPVPQAGGARLPDAGSQRGDPLRRRGPAHPPGGPAGLEPHGDLLHPG